MEEYPDMPRQVRLLDQPLRYLHNVGNLLAILFGLGRRPLLRQRPPSPAMDGIALRIAPFGNEALGEPFVERLPRSEEHTSELQSLMRISYAVFCLKKKNKTLTHKNYKKPA